MRRNGFFEKDRPRRADHVSLILFALFMISSIQAFADDPTSESLSALIQKNKKSCAGFLKSWQFLNDSQKEAEALNLTFSAGFDGNRAGDSDLYKLDVGASISKGVYPNQIRFRTGNSFQYKGKEFVENVTSLLINFDHNFLPWLKSYGFIERFTDSYLKILQRYEIGIGSMIESELFYKSKLKRIDWVGFKNIKMELFAMEVGMKAMLEKLNEMESSSFHEAAIDEIKKSVNDSISTELKTRSEEIINEFEMYGQRIRQMKEKRTERAQNPGDAAGEAENNGIQSVIPRIKEDARDFSGKRLDHMKEVLRQCNPYCREILFINEKEKMQKEAQQIAALQDRFKGIIQYEDTVITSVKKMKALLFLGMAFSLFNELEKAEAELKMQNQNEPDKIPLSAEQRLRLTIRPSLIYRPCDGLSFSLYYYMKLPLFKPVFKMYYDGSIDGIKKWDVRTDLFFSIKYDFPKTDWAKKLSLSLDFKKAYDRVPIYLTQDVIQPVLNSYQNKGITMPEYFKEKRHFTYSLKVEVTF